MDRTYYPTDTRQGQHLIYENVSEAMKQDKPTLIKLLEEHIDFEQIIPRSFYHSFYTRFGRHHIYFFGVLFVFLLAAIATSFYNARIF